MQGRRMGRGEASETLQRHKRILDIGVLATQSHVPVPRATGDQIIDDLAVPDEPVMPN